MPPSVTRQSSSPDDDVAEPVNTHPPATGASSSPTVVVSPESKTSTNATTASTPQPDTAMKMEPATLTVPVPTTDTSTPTPPPHAKPVAVGLINEGCTCYLNSLLQLLFHINYFRTAVYRIPPEKAASKKSLYSALQELFFGMQERTTPARTRALTDSFGWGESELMVQHDIQEMATLLRDALEEKMKGTEAEGTVHQLFEGRAEQVVETLDHSYVSRRPDVFYDIHLPIANHHTLLDSLRSLTAKDQLVGDNKYRVEEDGKPPVYKDAERSFRFCRFAPVTWFHLKRFDMDLTSPTLEMKKVNSVLEFPLVLDLQEFEQAESNSNSNSVNNNNENSHTTTTTTTSPQSPPPPLQAPSPAIYDLHGVIVHRGTVNSGHYYCYIRSWDAEKQAFTHWVEYEDENVRVVSEDLAVMGNYGGAPGSPGRHRYGELRANSASAYILSYVRRAVAPIVLAPCPIDVITQSIKDALRKNIEEEERALRRAEAARQQLTVYVLTEASLGTCTLDLQTSLLPPDLTKLRRYAEATLELKKHDPLQLAYEQLYELLLAPCGFPTEMCRFWRITGGAPTAPTQPGCGLAYALPTHATSPTGSTGATAAAGGSSGTGGGVASSERSGLNTRELHVGRALPTWQECLQSQGDQAILLQDFLTTAEQQKSNILGLYLQGPLLPKLSKHVPVGVGVKSAPMSHPATPTRAFNVVVCGGPQSLVETFTVSPTNAVTELSLRSPVPVVAVTVVLPHTVTAMRSCTMTVQLHDQDGAICGRYQEPLVVNSENMRVVWKVPKAATASSTSSSGGGGGDVPNAVATRQDSRNTEEDSPKLNNPTTASTGTSTTTARPAGLVSIIKFQVTNTQTGKSVPVVDAHVHVPADYIKLPDRITSMALSEPGHDRVLLLFKLFDHSLGSVRYLSEGLLDRALTPRHLEDWLLRVAGAERVRRSRLPLRSQPPRLRFFEESRASISREIHPDHDWMENLVNSGTTVVVQRALVSPLYRHIHVETFYRTQQMKELVRVVQVTPVHLDVAQQYRDQLARFAALRRSEPAREQALAETVDAFNTHAQREREKRMIESARASGATPAPPSVTTPTTTTPTTESPDTAAAPSSSKRSSQAGTRVDVDVDLNPFHTSLPALQQTVLRVTDQAICTMLLSWTYDALCDAIADHFMATPGSIRLYQSRDAEGTGPQRAPSSTLVTLENLLRMDAYSTTNTLFFEHLTVPRVLADQYATFNVTLRDAAGHALHCERYRLNRTDGTRQGLVRVVRQSIRSNPEVTDPWGTLEATLSAPQYTLLVVSDEEHLIHVIKEVRLTTRDGAPYGPENALDSEWQGLHLVLIALGPLARGEERVACCQGEYRNGEVHPFGNPFVITVQENTTVTAAMTKMLACTHVPIEALHRENHYATMMLTERACYFSNWDETVVMYWRCTQNTSDHVPSLVLNYNNPLDKPGSRYVAHHDQQLKITK